MISPNDQPSQPMETPDPSGPPQRFSTFIFTPEAARELIVSLGHSPDSLARLAQAGSEGSSHQLHALAYIASQDKARDLTDVYRELYPGVKTSMTPADEEARQAADAADDEGAWGKFTKET